MSDVFLTGIEEAARQVGVYGLVADNLLAGLIFTLACLLAMRFVVRAWLLSALGKKSGVFLSILVESSAMLFFVISAWRNPGVLVATLVWGAVIFKTIIHGI